MPNAEADLETAKYLARELRKARAASRAFESIARQFQQLFRSVRGGYVSQVAVRRSKELEALTQRQQERYGYSVTIDGERGRDG